MVERPYYWFHYGFESGGKIPIYHELYPNALWEVSEGVSGYLYEVQAEEEQVIPFKNIPCARLVTEAIVVFILPLHPTTSYYKNLMPVF